MSTNDILQAVAIRACISPEILRKAIVSTVLSSKGKFRVKPEEENLLIHNFINNVEKSDNTIPKPLKCVNNKNNDEIISVKQIKAQLNLPYESVLKLLNEGNNRLPSTKVSNGRRHIILSLNFKEWINSYAGEFRVACERTYLDVIAARKGKTIDFATKVRLCKEIREAKNISVINVIDNYLKNAKQEINEKWLTGEISTIISTLYQLIYGEKIGIEKEKTKKIIAVLSDLRDRIAKGEV